MDASSRRNDAEEPEELVEINENENNGIPGPAEQDLIPETLPAKWIMDLEKSAVPTLVMDAELVIRWRNEAFRVFRETEGLSYVGRPFHALFATFADAGARNGMIANLKNAESGYSWQGRVDGRGHGNRLFRADLSILPLCTGEAPPVWYLAVVSDLTESFKADIRANFASILQASLLKDEDTGNHVARVNAYAKTIAAAMKGGPLWFEVDDDFIEDIGYLAAFHDVGKIGTPESILLKAGELSLEEWDLMKEHPINGALILDAHPNPMAKQIARSHHERWDGTGYPYGLAGDDIPLSGRIVAIADVYDALRTRRPYKEPFDEKSAVSIIKEGAGSHFDPNLVEIFLELKKQFNEIFGKLSD